MIEPALRYGTGPAKLSQMAKSPIRLNPGHSYTVFRVRMDGLKPRTTYYFTVDSTEADGRGDGVKSTIRHFTTPRHLGGSFGEPQLTRLSSQHSTTSARIPVLHISHIVSEANTAGPEVARARIRRRRGIFLLQFRLPGTELRRFRPSTFLAS
jgi:hypothetical protein